MTKMRKKIGVVSNKPLWRTDDVYDFTVLSSIDKKTLNEIVNLSEQYGGVSISVEGGKIKVKFYHK